MRATKLPGETAPSGYPPLLPATPKARKAPKPDFHDFPENPDPPRSELLPSRGELGSRETPVSRKVRAPKGRVVGNAHRPQGQGKCHREQTADGRDFSRIR